MPPVFPMRKPGSAGRLGAQAHAGCVTEVQPGPPAPRRPASQLSGVTPSPRAPPCPLGQSQVSGSHMSLGVGGRVGKYRVSFWLCHPRFLPETS